jgi:hypothetical protein
MVIALLNINLLREESKRRRSGEEWKLVIQQQFKNGAEHERAKPAKMRNASRATEISYVK